MSGLNVRQDACELDFLSLGALIHRLDPGVIPFRKAKTLEIHVSGGEYNVAANLADCFGLKTGVATAMVNYGIGELVQGRIRDAESLQETVEAAQRSVVRERLGAGNVVSDRAALSGDVEHRFDRDV